MNMDLKDGDYIVITGYNTDNFYQDRFYKHLINKPTRVWDFGTRGLHLTHPYLDLVPFSNELKYEKIESSEDLPSHNELKSLTQNLDTIMGREGKNELKNLRVKKVKKLKLKETIIKIIYEEDEKKKTRAEEKLSKMIDKINDNILSLDEVGKLFGNIETFLDILSKKGLMNRIDPFAESFEDIQNSLFYAFYKSDPNFIKKIADNFLSDISKVGDDYYFKADFNELASFYNTNRNTIDQDTIKSILSGEYDDTDSGYDTDDVYRDVYEQIDDYAKSVVDEFIVNELEAMKVFKFSMYKKIPDLIEEIAEEQETEGEINLTNEVIVRLMVDADCLEFLINKQLSEVEGNLNSIFSVSYGDVLSSEWYNTLWNSLEGEVIDNRDGEEYSYDKAVWLKNNTRGTKRMFGKKYKVTKCIHTVIGSWLEMNKDKNGQRNNTIPYFGSYYNLIEDSMQYGPMSWLDIGRLDEYPDYRELRKSMSSNVENYF